MSGTKLILSEIEKLSGIKQFYSIDMIHASPGVLWLVFPFALYWILDFRETTGRKP